MRFHDWDIRLSEYIDSVRNRSFDWATFECLTFANEAVKAQTGNGFADDWIGRYGCHISALRLYKKMQKILPESDIIEAVDKRLLRRKAKRPSRGDVVARPNSKSPVLGYSFGVAVSDLVAFLELDGVVFVRPISDDIFWCVS